MRVINQSVADSVTVTLIEDDEDNDGTVDVTYQPTICDDAELAPGEATDCTFTRFVGGAPGDTITDNATVTMLDDDNETVIRSATATVTVVDVPSSIAVVKTATPDNVDEPGGPVQFTVQVTNTSPADTVTLTSIEDDENNDGTVDQTYNDLASICDSTELAPTEVATCTFSHAVNGNPGDTITDAVTVLGTDDDVAPVSGGDTATVTVNDVPSSIAVVKTATPDTVPDPGGNVTFDVTVTNTSLVDTVTLTLIEDDETDDGTVDVTYPVSICDIQVLLPTEVATCTFVRAVNGTAGETFTDRVTITGVDDDAGAVSGDATATVTIGPPPIGPPAQLNLVSTGGSQFEWNPTGSATSYHLYRGDMQELISTGTYAQDPAEVSSAAQMCWLSQPQYDDDFVPEAGAVVFYLVTVDDGLSEGDLGYARQNANPCRQ